MGLVCSKNEVEEQVSPSFAKRFETSCGEESAPLPQQRPQKRLRTWTMRVESRTPQHMQSYAVGGGCCGTVAQEEFNHAPRQVME